MYQQTRIGCGYVQPRFETSLWQDISQHDNMKCSVRVGDNEADAGRGLNYYATAEMRTISIYIMLRQ